LRDARTRVLLLASTTLVSINWLVFIWAIGHDRVLEASLGYYINPLMNILLGVLVLRERLTGWQGVAVALAVAGVLNLGLRVEGFPWVSLALAGSFSLYGLLRKTMRVESIDGLFVETALLTLIALSYLVVLGVRGAGALTLAEPGMAGLLMLSGAVTAIPLILFASGARRLDYATVGFFQYVAPSGQFLLAVLVYHEPFTPAHLVTFALIWTALAIFSVQSFGAARRRPVGR
ncbi:MAG TPA: EamA family transporter RarD, partial [Kiloniellales bacterium]|nr:EamA family transporter RarD [Kiloniellales bacterium]